MVARFVEKSRQPSFIPGAAVLGHILQFVVVREDLQHSTFVADQNNSAARINLSMKVDICAVFVSAHLSSGNS